MPGIALLVVAGTCGPHVKATATTDQCKHQNGLALVTALGEDSHI